MGKLKRAIELGARGVLVYCSACLNVGHFSPNRALRLFGGDTKIKDIPKRCRCSCGAKASRAVADWKRLSRGGGPPQPIVPKEWGRLP